MKVREGDRATPPNVAKPEPWRPYCAILPSGLIVDSNILQHKNPDDETYCALFGADTAPDGFTKRSLMDAYYKIAFHTTLTLSKFMR